MSRQRTVMDQHEGRARMWQSMRMLRTFTVADLQATAEVSRASATHYVRALLDAGYLQPAVRNARICRNKFRSYWLTKNTGPHAPRVSRDGSVFDPNIEPTHAKRVRGEVKTVTIPRAEYDRALRCIRLCESIRAAGAASNVRQCAAKALEVAR